MSEQVKDGAISCRAVEKGCAASRAVPVLTPDMKPVVGKFYLVPCVKLLDACSTWRHRHPAADRHGWIPVIGTEHHDRETIGFQPMHIHVDARFLGQQPLANIDSPLAARPAAQRAMTHPVSTYSDGHANSPIRFDRATRRMLCKREMPDFPKALYAKWFAFDRQFANCKLKPGNICPHRGIDLTPFIKEDGTVICPGHGLRWDTKTGAHLPYHAEAS